jgi:hypothetical protein
VLEHDGDRGWILACSGGEAVGDAAKSGKRQIERHAHSAHGAVQYHALAMQIDDAQMLVGLRI